MAIINDDADSRIFNNPFGEFAKAHGFATYTDQKTDTSRYKNSTLEIVSKVAYLIGVPERIFDNAHEPPEREIYDELETEKTARIIRHLCIVRTAIERNYKSINDKMKSENISIFSQPENVPPESLAQLAEDGIVISKKPRKRPSDYIIEINDNIQNRINNCRDIFPDWLNWEYLRNLFIMPDGRTEEGTKVASDLYYANKAWYPYQVYINWVPQDEGNILYNDKKFVSYLYQLNNDIFEDYNKVSDVSTYVKTNIYEFIEASEKLIMVVDCENSDPYRLFAALKNLDSEYTEKISSIILFDDIHTASTWEILKRYTHVPVEYMLVDRLKEGKSLVDGKLIARVSKEHYLNGVDSFVLVSSDSDYWSLISSLEEARFIVMVEHEKCGTDLKRVLMENGIFYCYLDDFYSGNADEIKRGALIREMKRYIAAAIELNVNDMFAAALVATRIRMTQAEKERFMKQYIRTMIVSIADNGDVTLDFKNK